MVQVPALTSVTVDPLTVHTNVAKLENVTVNPEDAVALTKTDTTVIGSLLNAPNVIVWLRCATAKL
jgi:hypothetical protein